MQNKNLPSDNSNGKGNKKKINLNVDAFSGKVNHKDILEKLLSEIGKIDFREVIGLPTDEDLKQKHFIFGVVKHLLQTAIAKKWDLCKVYDYTYIYNGEYWKQCSKDDFRNFLTEAAIKMGIPDYDAKQYEFGDKLLKQFLSDAHLPTPESDPKKILINLQNGTFEFTDKGLQLREFNSKDFLTYQLPFKFDDKATCPMFDDYLLKVLPDENSRKLIQEFAGFVFTNLNFEKCLVLLGSGGNGKSVFYNVLRAVVGVENILEFQIGLFNHEYNRAKLTNVLLNYSSEKGFDLQPDTFKALISGESIQAREPYGKSFTIRKPIKFIINCNELPKETENTDAYFRRFLIVLFDVKITDKDKDINLADKIIANELPGVFNWMLAGLKRIKEQQKFTGCEKTDFALKEFRKQGDNVQLFIEGECFIKSNKNKISLKELYSAYKVFCEENGYKKLGCNNFSKRLDGKGFEKARMNDGATAFLIEKTEITF
jgi:putative DNA primase/helicase